MLEKINLIYRNKKTGKIEKYGTVHLYSDLKERIEKFNKEDQDLNVEITQNEDLIVLIDLAEKNKEKKRSDFKYIEDAVERLRDEIYTLMQETK